MNLRFGASNEKKTEREKVEERREEVLTRGRKFKYPLQYAKHKLVINTIIIAVVAMAGLVAAGWVALYRFQDMGDIMYRISRVIPVAVAKIDGESVRFSDYLMIARSSLSPIEKQSGVEGSVEDKKAMREEYKRSALTQAESLTYALKLGRELGVTVSDEEVKKVFDEHRKVGGAERSEESFLKVLSTNFGLSKSEYERALYLALMRAKVEEAIDTEAKKTAEKVEALLKENGGDYEKAAAGLEGKVEVEKTGGLIDNKNVDGGRSGVASTLEAGGQSGRFLSSNGDGYYFVKLIEKTETQVNYVSIFVRFTEFEKRVEEVRAQGKVTEYIEIGGSFDEEG